MYTGLIDAIVHLLAGVFGVGFLVQGGLLLRQSVSMTAPDADQISDATSGDTVAIEGTARAKKDEPGRRRTTTAPLSGEECVFAAWRVEEFFGHELGTHSGWTEQASGYDGERFELTDGRGTISVAIDGDWDFLDTEFDLEGLDSPQQTVSIDEDRPPAIQDFESTTGVRDRTPATLDVPTTESGPKQGDRRYYEATITPGDSVFVSGVATEGAETADLVVSDEQDQRLFISDSGQNGATKDRLFGVVVLSLVGLILLWYAIAPLL